MKCICQDLTQTQLTSPKEVNEMSKTNLPGFTAEVSLHNATQPYYVAQAQVDLDAAVYPAQSSVGWPWDSPPPIYCPFGSAPVLVKTGGERVCLRYADPYCLFKGTPFEKCWPARCINWQTTKEEQHWECFPYVQTSSDITAFHQLFVRRE